MMKTYSSDKGIEFNQGNEKSKFGEKLIEQLTNVVYSRVKSVIPALRSFFIVFIKVDKLLNANEIHTYNKLSQNLVQNVYK